MTVFSLSAYVSTLWCVLMVSCAFPQSQQQVEEKEWKRLRSMVSVLESEQLKDPLLTKEDEQAAWEAGINALIQTVYDPYAHVVPSSALRAKKNEDKGLVQFFGVTYTKTPQGFFITNLHEDSPLRQHGAKTGDEILAINHQMVRELTAQRVYAILQKAKETNKGTKKVHFQLQPAIPPGSTQSPEPIEFDVGLKLLSLPCVPAFYPIPLPRPSKKHGIGYLKLTNFTVNAASSVQKALVALRDMLEGLQCLILDLRDNPGGHIIACQEIAGLLFPSDTVLVKQKIRQESKTAIYPLHPIPPKGAANDFHGTHLIVLIGPYTASAAEMLAAACQEVHQPEATVIGTRSYGKGLGQVGIPLKTGDTLWVSVLSNLTPKYELPIQKPVPNAQAQYSGEEMVFGVAPSTGYEVEELGLYTEHAWAIKNGVLYHHLLQYLQEHRTNLEAQIQDDTALYAGLPNVPDLHETLNRIYAESQGHPRPLVFTAEIEDSLAKLCKIILADMLGGNRARIMVYNAYSPVFQRAVQLATRL